jgi:hypothetical protein
MDDLKKLAERLSKTGEIPVPTIATSSDSSKAFYACAAEVLSAYSRLPSMRPVADPDKMNIEHCDLDRLWLCRLRRSAFLWFMASGWIVRDRTGLFLVSGDVRARFQAVT